VREEEGRREKVRIGGRREEVENEINDRRNEIRAERRRK
jgi:hypothetical protein